MHLKARLVFYDLGVSCFCLIYAIKLSKFREYSNFLHTFSANVRKRCGLGAAYHAGKMVKENAEAGSASECLAKCNADNKCEFWDYGDRKDNGKTYCRLRYADGGGPELGGYFAYGSKNCNFGNGFNIS